MPVLQLVELHGCKKWALIASKMPNKGSKQCRRRWQNYLNNADAKQGGWSGDEARAPQAPTRSLCAYAAPAPCAKPPARAHAATRCACRLAARCASPRAASARAYPACARLSRAPPGSAAQDALLLEGHAKFGNRWTEIAKMVTGRTDNGARGRRARRSAARRASDSAAQESHAPAHAARSREKPARGAGEEAGQAGEAARQEAQAGGRAGIARARSRGAAAQAAARAHHRRPQVRR